MKTKELRTFVHSDVMKIIFIFVSAVFTSTILLLYSYLLKDLIPSSNLIREYVICFGQIGFQALLILFFYRKYILLDYLYQMMIVSFMGGLLLTPVLVSAVIFFPFSFGTYYFAAYFLIIVAFMFFDHRKRVKKINAPLWLTYTWVLYRLLVLFMIL